MEKVIWCLFSVANNYDQPNNNLCVWYTEKPSLETLFAYFCADISHTELVVSIVNVWAGQEQRIAEADYRLEQVKECISL